MKLQALAMEMRCASEAGSNVRRWHDVLVSIATEFQSAAQSLQAATARAEHASPLLDLMRADTTAPERDSAWLRMYAAKIRDRTASSWEIPNTVASTMEDIADRLQAADQVRVEALALVEQWRVEARLNGWDRVGMLENSVKHSCADQLASLLTRPPTEPTADRGTADKGLPAGG